jgi:hypothetical protein
VRTLGWARGGNCAAERFCLSSPRTIVVGVCRVGERLAKIYDALPDRTAMTEDLKPAHELTVP